jgi:hypothetical protein
MDTFTSLNHATAPFAIPKKYLEYKFFTYPVNVMVYPTADHFQREGSVARSQRQAGRWPRMCLHLGVG